MDNQLHPKKVRGFCSFRYGLAVLLHFCNVVIAAQRVCLNLTMVAMVNRTDPQDLTNTSAKTEMDYVKNPVYNWSPDIQGIIFSSIFYGILAIQIPVGYLSGIYSIKKMVGSALFLSSVLSLFIPRAAQVGKTLIIVCRVAQGMAQGTVSTAQHEMWIKWAPPLERGRLTSICLSGFMLAPFIVLLVSGFICDLLGWPMVFYIFGAYGCVLCLIWFVLVYDDPKDHPCISVNEKEYIISSLAQQASSSRQSLPIKAMLKSLPLWAISLNGFAFLWTNTLLVTYTPTFINTKLHVDIKQNGLLSGLPYLFACICGLLAGQMSDYFLSRNIFNILTIRKLFTTLGLISPVIFSMCLLYLSFNFYSTVIFLTLANATTSFCLGGGLINALDIAPRYYGFLKAVTSVIGMIGGISCSTVTGLILSQGKAKDMISLGPTFLYTERVTPLGEWSCRNATSSRKKAP
ncbi:sodium-dependent phosphate transport protein 1-like isoform X2 [Perognathus longimembris pacificus]|uniref:sodium-dependent phosphate transport protein 1-like isoform X2 n=1 Tax=Perognathus longimembris pacificus TaxID=214514 RepID=UPI002019A599|nr:sodium-dependent phosphate transport protein 1-like isoform X2 [Perognathus longimembris pacificus]